ncbi:MAG: T9SS type A sorting domain-containing protein, partial [Calditrichia bacterium]
GWAPSLQRSARNPRVSPGGDGFVDASTVIVPLEVPATSMDRSMGDSIYLMGGETFNGDTDTTEIYDLRTRQIRLGSPILSPRQGMTSVTLNDRIYLIGGFSSSLNQPLDNVDIYSVITGISPPGEPVILIDNAEISGFPNPFNGRITLKLEIPFRGQNNLTIFDLLGKKVKTLHSGILNKGTYQFGWEATDNANRKVTSGIYFAVLRGQNYSRNFKIFYVR